MGARALTDPLSAIMEHSYEEHYHRVEACHWWFRARREMVIKLVGQLDSGRDQRILDIGCSSGLLLKELQDQGHEDVRGIDASIEGIARCERGGLRAQVMDAHRLDFGDGTFDGITASDVLEHLQHDSLALREWRRVLKPGGWLIVFVPAFMWLWTRHDTVNRHFRRYTRPQLIHLLAQAGFEVQRSSYWNTGLFFPVALLRLWRRRGGQPVAVRESASDMFLPPVFLNGMLRAWMALENALHGSGLNSRVGISVMVVARRSDG